MVGAVLRTLLAQRPVLLGLAHLAVFVLVYKLAFLLRFDFRVPERTALAFWQSLVWILPVKLGVFYALGHFQGWWRYVTFADLAALLRATAIASLAIFLVNRVMDLQIPRTVLVLDAMAGILVLGSIRSSWRMMHEQLFPAFRRDDYRYALLVGDDPSSGLIAHQIHSHSHLRYRVRALVTTSGTLPGAWCGGIPVLGGLGKVAEFAARYGAEDVLVIAGTLPGGTVRELMRICKAAKLTLKIIPPMEEFVRGYRRIPVRDIDIDDLLGRDPVKLDLKGIGTLLRGERVLVTGAGGSIGAEICRQVLKHQPAELVLLGRGENRVFTTEQELRLMAGATRVFPVIADVTDRARMRGVFDQYRSTVVFHAAAHKHVPLMEANIGEAVKNNCLGTRTVADLADEFAAKAFVLISTDKAVNPTSIMGATKHLAERYVHALSVHSSTRFMVVRFGNVLGSAGSVVPLFQEQIRRGGPITVTDPRMRRFFMTIPEASMLVLQAAAIGKGGEIFVLDMGEPIRVVDLARDLIRLSGLPEDAIEITFTGMRPGEKLYEELYFDDERSLATCHPKVRAALHRPADLEEVSRQFVELESLRHFSPHVLRLRLGEMVPEYDPGSEHPSRQAVA